TSLLNKKTRKWQYSVLLLLLLGASFFIVDSLNKKHEISYPIRQSPLSQKSKNGNNQENQYKAKNQLSKSLSKNNKGEGNLTQIATASKSHVYSFNTNVSFKNKVLLNSEPLNKEIDNSLAHFDLGLQPKLSVDNLKPNIQKFNQLQNNNIPLITNKIITQASGKTDKAGNANTKKSNHIGLYPQPKTFYGTFFFAPNFATVKFQHINKPGYLIGIGFGYRINNRISAQIGLQRVQANFYSDAKYVDPSNLKLKPSLTLDDLNGNNKLTEVPVALKYVLFKNNYHFFGTAGTTVALITHTEKYDYDVIKNNGTPKDVYRTFSALTATKFLSSVNLSAGYETSVSNLFNIKVEPYFQAATKGLGVGNLPVSNFGVNIGIIKNLK
ncbi:MAG TPA: hypothetical protein VGI61_03695, partial [Parafilimonas sp.]